MNRKELYDYGRKNLKYKEESIILCEELYGFSRKDIIMSPDVVVEDTQAFFEAVKRREQGEPLQYILGYAYFDSMKLKVEEGVLIPREDSMVLVNCAVDFIKDQKLKGLDLCSGTGAIAISVENSCGKVEIEALELFKTPLKCLVFNIAHFSTGRVTCVESDVTKSFSEYKNLDFILSNPPYIKSEEISTLQTEVQNEPHTALDGGEDGLYFYKIICEKWKNALKIGGFLAVEIGDTQGEEVGSLFINNGLRDVKILKDLNNLPRVVCGVRER